MTGKHVRRCPRRRRKLVTRADRGKAIKHDKVLDLTIVTNQLDQHLGEDDDNKSRSGKMPSEY
ncbi:hypothetical protein AMAG_15890 [Allomyces macrogynus ATCC 38327]|uniref:Uncharacterized protein n=1 Tax=Allomyces macrogynus (strain ATCC 38327) TaxID=578462 RepID=A0A0L0T940_ALLM3|nr:hypothetical protein AMAG_15890 [Allomyces macrogynus ATCC 38327]|eukprot:KNE71235.1 hypothetical protein AMAG_15890 [Allomyces macrogynus ATCC 38327]